MPMLLRPLAGALALLASAAIPAFAQDVEVDLELVLAVDVSWSMDPEEQAFQRAGYVAAFRDPVVLRAIRDGAHGRIAVTYVEWAGGSLQEVVVPWTLVDGEASAEALAASLAAGVSGRLRRTSISGALLFSRPLYDSNGFSAPRQVVDVSGDGANNEGTPVESARDELVSAGITVNGLPILLKTDGPGSMFSIPDLDVYYEDCVIGGPGAFSIPVRAVEEFATAIRRKLILEIAGPAPADGLARPVPAQLRLDPPRKRADCLIGEKMWLQRQRYFYDDR